MSSGSQPPNDKYVALVVNPQTTKMPPWHWKDKHFQQYFTYIVVVEEAVVHGENHRPATSNWQTSSHNVVSSTPHLSGNQIRNVSGDRDWLHR